MREWQGLELQRSVAWRSGGLAVSSVSGLPGTPPSQLAAVAILELDAETRAAGGRRTKCATYEIKSIAKMGEITFCKSWRWRHGEVLEPTGLNMGASINVGGSLLGWREGSVFFQASNWVDQHRGHHASKAVEIRHCMSGPFGVQVFCDEYGAKAAMTGWAGGGENHHLKWYAK